MAENGLTKVNYKILRAVNGQYYFNLVAANGAVIGRSELYVTKSNAERGRNDLMALLPAVSLL